jgi:acyl carrier protein
MSDLYEDVKSVIVDVLKIDGSDLKPETRFIEDLKADSMDQFFLIDGLCEKFNLTISDEDARKSAQWAMLSLISRASRNKCGGIKNWCYTPRVLIRRTPVFDSLIL